MLIRATVLGTALLGLLGTTQIGEAGGCRIIRRSAPCHEVVSEVVAVETPVAVAAVVQEVLVPSFVFQTLSAFAPAAPAYSPAAPAYAAQPYATQPYAAPAAAPAYAAAATASSLSEQDLDRIAARVAVHLSRSQSSRMLAMADEPPAVVAEAPRRAVDEQHVVNYMGHTCASCHREGVASKGGVTLFNASNQFIPSRDGQPLRRSVILAAVESGSMPLGALADPAKRAPAEIVAWMRANWLNQ